MSYINWYNFKTYSNPTISDAKGNSDLTAAGTNVAVNNTTM